MTIEIYLPGWVVQFLHISVILIFIIGLLCFLIRKDYIRQIMGLKLMLQSICLGMVTAGYEHDTLFIPQSVVISALIVEAVIIGLALTMMVQLAKTRASTSPPETKETQDGEKHA